MTWTGDGVMDLRFDGDASGRGWCDIRTEWVVVPTEDTPRLIQLPEYDRYPACDGIGWLVLFAGARRWVYSGTDPDCLDLDSLALLWLYAETTDLEGLEYTP